MSSNVSMLDVMAYPSPNAPAMAFQNTLLPVLDIPNATRNFFSFVEPVAEYPAHRCKNQSAPSAECAPGTCARGLSAFGS